MKLQDLDIPGKHNDAAFVPVLHPTKPGKTLYRLTEDFVYAWTAQGTKQRITIKAGFEWDGASIPEIATFVTWLIPWFETIQPMGKHAYASLLHDYLWMYRGQLPVGVHEYLCGDGRWRDAAYNALTGEPVWDYHSSNRLFLRVLGEDGVGKAERDAMYAAVNYTLTSRWMWRSGKLPDDARPAKLPGF